ncbi:hypothetical protein ACEPPN_007452 [Leptodophora sp. 'Broadleaf-Isolate-01']
MVTLALTVTLTSKREMFPPWLVELKAQAMVRGAWHYVDPDGPDSSHTADLEPALPPTIEELIHIEDKHRDAYLDVLETGKQGSIHPNTWLDNWFQALARAKSLKLNVVEGTSAIQTFLETVAVRVAPEWSTEQHRRVLEADAMGEKPSRTLEEYSRILETYLQVTTAAKKRLNRKSTGGSGAYTTLGGRGDGTNMCPCQRKHAWLPGDCSRLELALTGRTKRQIQLSDDDKKSIRQRLELSEYQQLRERLREKGWLGSNEGAKGKATWEGKGPIEA